MKKMINKKNKLMLLITSLVIILVIIVNISGRFYHLFDHGHVMEHSVTSYEIEKSFSLLLNLLLFIPILLVVASFGLYKKKPSHQAIPYLLTLALTFGSIAIISGGGGRVEFHFSIFMVVAALGYYQNIRLLTLMTTIFALQHLLGFFIFPEVVFGVHSYSFFMLIIHAAFLLLTSSAVGWQVVSTKSIEDALMIQQREQRGKIIEEIVTSLSSTSKQLTQLSLLLKNDAQSTFHASSQLSEAISQVASGFETQKHSVEKNVAIISSISSGIQTVSQNAQIATEKANISAEQANKGSKLVLDLSKQITEINQSVEESFHTITTLHNSSQDIEHIIEVISTISDQTNLLALNASIEAARAGEYGKGFSVVANEVRKLAEQSAESSKHIAALVKQNLVEANKSVTAMERVKSNAKSGLALIQDSNRVFNQIFESSNSVATQIGEISTLADKLSLSSETVNSSMVDMASVTEKSVQSTQHAQHTTEKQHQQTEKTMKAVFDLSQVIEELEAVITKLQVEQ